VWSDAINSDGDAGIELTRPARSELTTDPLPQGEQRASWRRWGWGGTTPPIGVLVGTRNEPDTPVREASMASWDQQQATTVWKIALGVCFGIVAAGLIAFGARLWMAQYAMQQITQQANDMVARQQAIVQTGIERNRAAQAERDRIAAERAEATRQLTAQRQRADAEARQASIDEATRREAAWAKFYRKPAMCDNPPSNEALVECANQHIRAKRAFEAAYSSGKL